MSEPKEQIRERIDVVDLISEYLPLKPAGSGSFKTTCPFHQEKTPSFYVSRSKQIWHCFGCDKGGDIFSFVMDMDGMDFPAAMRHLGKKAGVEIPEYRPDKNKDIKERLIEMHELAASFYNKILKEHTLGKEALAYATKRGINKELLNTFQIGCAPEKWSALATFLQKRGYSEKELEQAGLCKKGSRGDMIDRFHNRLMIPLRNPKGQIVGFTGRLLGPQGEKTGPKYLNSPETLIYKKSAILFGFSLAKQGIRFAKNVIIVEGNLDVVASHKADVTNIVASSGTALTQQQIQTLKRQTTSLLFCFDADAAGFAAASRGIRLAQSMGCDVQVISLAGTDTKDADELIQKHPAKWKEVVTHSIPVMQFHFDERLKRYDLADINQKKQFTHELLEELAYVQDVVERDHWLQKLSDTTHMEKQTLQRLIKSPEKTPLPQQKPQKPTPAKQTPVKKADPVVTFLITASIAHPTLFPHLQTLFEHETGDDFWMQVYKKANDVYNRSNFTQSSQKTFFRTLSQELEREQETEMLHILQGSLLKIETLLEGLQPEHVRKEWDKHAQHFKEDQRAIEKRKLEIQIRDAERSGDHERASALSKRYNDLLINPS